MQVDAAQLTLFWLIAARVGGVLIATPPFTAVFLPGGVKVGFSLLLALFLLPFSPKLAAPPSSLLTFGGAVAAELAFGLAVGYFIRLLFGAVQMAGSFLDLELGFNLANLVTPLYDGPMPAVTLFFYLISVLAFFLVGGEEATVRLLAQTLRSAPPGAWHMPQAWLGEVLDRVAWALVTAVQLALPILAASFLVTIALAIVSRAVPQVNAFFLGLPLKQGVGLIAFAVALPLYMHIFQGLLQDGLARLGGGG